MDPFRIYPPDEPHGTDGYPAAWHRLSPEDFAEWSIQPDAPLVAAARPGVKDLVRAIAGHRCERCGHPYAVGQSSPEWSPCDERCTHAGKCRGQLYPGLEAPPPPRPIAFSAEWPHAGAWARNMPVEAAWRVLTVHHLNGDKSDLRWWNLAALCQRCHLQVQGRVVMERGWMLEHSPWFRLHAAGWYAVKYEGRDVTREEAERRADELLSYERLA